jgi:hypothetical protein
LNRSPRTLQFFTAFLAALLTAPLPAEEPKKESPRVGMSMPLAILPGVKTKITLRGWRLDTVTEVRVVPAPVAVTIASKGKATVPEKFDPMKIGDTQVEIELELPKETPLGVASVTIVGPNGESKPYEMLVGGELPVVAEKEPNNGFAQAQLVSPPQMIDGAIDSLSDVDVFAVDLVAGEQVTFEVVAQRRGSALDSLVTLFDSRSVMLAINDDSGPETRDSLLHFTAPAAGRYFLALTDANQMGGPAHPYRLVVRKGG